MTKRECAIVMAFTGKTMLEGNDLMYFYEYVSEIMERPLFTHEIAEYSDEIKEKAKPDFVQICKSATDERKPAARAKWEKSFAYRLNPITMTRSDAIAIICSRCKCAFIPDNGVNSESKYRFCPSCGSKMEGGAENAVTR